MAITAYLRAYEPVSSFPAEERGRWVDPDGEPVPADAHHSRRWLLLATLTREVATDAEGAFVIRTEDRVLVCPWRTRLRMLAGMLAFRNSIPEEVADAFVPEAEARQAASELARLSDARPELRSHILHANWHVPLRWFAAFDDSERVLTEDHEGLRVRYEAPMGAAKQRLGRALGILEYAGFSEDGVIEAVRELAEWVGCFDDDGVLELDYGSVSSIFDADDLVDDRCAAEVWGCLHALEAGDVVKASKLFEALSERWGAARAREVVN